MTIPACVIMQTWRGENGGEGKNSSHAREETVSFFNSYVRNHPNITREQAVRLAWEYFYSLQDKPLTKEAIDWFEQNIDEVKPEWH
jgi:hypothetical protein